MKYLLTILGCLFIHIAGAQNIVPNPSFEEDTACPNAFSQIYFCDDWGTGNEGTPDYYNACDSISTSRNTFAVPNNWQGSQAAYAGQAYAGIYGYSEFLVADYHEYLRVAIPPMDSGASYHVSMEVSLADSSGYASNGLGMLFNTFGSYLGVSTINAVPQVDFTSFGVITNINGWTRLSGTLTADSAYTQLIIGVFKDSGNIFKVQIQEPPWFMGYSYYYIDSVIVEKITGAGVPALPAATATCIYPNPLNTGFALLTFPNPQQQPHTFILYNTQGQVVKRQVTTSGQVSIGRAGLLPGLYFYQLQDENGGITDGKFVVGP